MPIETFTVDPSGKATIIKDPDAILDYTFDWTSYLAAISDTLVTATFTITGGAINSQNVVGPIATAWVSGGIVGTPITLACRIVTAGGRIDERTVFIKPKQR